MPRGQELRTPGGLISIRDALGLLNDIGEGRFDGPCRFPPANCTIGVTASVLNGDRYQDIATADRGGTASVLRRK